jgi:hypothetical protein
MKSQIQAALPKHNTDKILAQRRKKPQSGGLKLIR